jgi:hypothetical protein
MLEDSAMENNSKKLGLAKLLTIWLGSFIIIATFLFFYVNIPLSPLLLGGLVALGMTLYKHFRQR